MKELDTFSHQLKVRIDSQIQSVNKEKEYFVNQGKKIGDYTHIINECNTKLATLNWVLRIIDETSNRITHHV